LHPRKTARLNVVPMKFSIRTGKHRSFPPVIGIYYERRSFRKSVFFHSSCRYTPEAEDDTHKVFGIGYGNPAQILWTLVRRLVGRREILHHAESARFGWRYNPYTNKIALDAYCYVGGERIIRPVCEVPLNREVHLEIYVSPREYFFGVCDPLNIWRTAACVRVARSHKKKWGYALGPYFGGQNTAPHDISITLKNLNP
jgi:hypothetical protein